MLITKQIIINLLWSEKIFLCSVNHLELISNIFQGMEFCCRVFHGAHTRRGTRTPWNAQGITDKPKTPWKALKKKYFQKIIKHNYFYEFLEQVGEEEKKKLVLFFAFVAINAKMTFQTFTKKAGKSV